MYTYLRDFDYKIEDNEIHIKKYNGIFDTVNIAPTYKIGEDEYKVTKLLNSQIFEGTVTTVYVPKTVTHIGAQAFNCSTLKNIFVDKDNEKYLSQDGILFNKNKTTLIKVPPFNNVKKLDLTGVKTIKENACAYCMTLQEVVLDNKLKALNAFAFQNCENLCEINLPINLEKIGRHCFYYCTKLNIKNIPEKVRVVAAAAFQYCKSLSTIKLPDNLEILGMRAFDGCINLKSINIPKNINYIQDYALSQTALENLMILHDIKISPVAFSSTKIKNLYLQSLPLNVKLEDLIPIFPKLENIFLLNDNILQKYEKLIKTLEMNNIHFYSIKNVEKLEEEGYDFGQINQLINGYEQNLILTNIPISISADVLRELNKCWKIDKQKTFEVILMLSEPAKLENTIDIFNKINEIQQRDINKLPEREVR